ncbi:hypothetical protein ACFFRR_004166 [Megaselia abdita]
MCAYLPEDYPLDEHLTVLETMQFATDMKLGSQIRNEHKKVIIDDILSYVQLDGLEQRLVHELEPSEDRRLAIATELIANPQILLFDEPTAGLDSLSAVHLLSVLQRLAREGRVVACAIRQPISGMLTYFDDVMVMSEGQMLYCGATNKLIEFFQESGLKCPDYYNPVDFAIEVALKERGGDISQFIRKTKDALRKLRNYETTGKKSKKCNCGCEDNLKDSEKEKEKLTKKRIAAGAWAKFKALVKKKIRSMFRDFMLVQARILIHAVIGALLGGLFHNVGKDSEKSEKFLTNTSNIFCSIVFILFFNIFPAIMSSSSEKKSFVKQHLNGWFSVPVYFCSRVIADLPMLFMCPTLFVGIAYFLTGQPAEYQRFLMFWFIGFLIAFIGQTIGMIFGTSFKLALAIILVPAVCLPLLMFSGYFIRRNELNEYTQRLSDVSFLRYALEGMMQAIYGYDRNSLECSEGICFFANAQKFMKYMGMDGNLYAIDILALILTVLILNAILFISMVVAVKRRNK